MITFENVHIGTPEMEQLAIQLNAMYWYQEFVQAIFAEEPDDFLSDDEPCISCLFASGCADLGCLVTEYARERASIERGYLQANASITELERHAQDYKLLISASDDKDEINSLCLKLHAIEHAQNVIESTCSDCGHQCDGICIVDYDAYLEQQRNLR